MNERDFSVAGKEFKLSKIDPFKQFHIVRRLGPILGDIIPVAQEVQKMMRGKTESEMGEEQKLQAISKLVQPVMSGLSKLSDEDANHVLLGLLSAVEMKHAGAWAKLVRGDSLMIENLELPVMLQAAGRAFAYNLSGFFAIAPQVSHG